LWQISVVTAIQCTRGRSLPYHILLTIDMLTNDQQHTSHSNQSLESGSIESVNTSFRRSASRQPRSTSEFLRTILSSDDPISAGASADKTSDTAPIITVNSEENESNFAVIGYCTLEVLSAYIYSKWDPAGLPDQKTMLRLLAGHETRKRYGGIKLGQFEAWARVTAGISTDQPPVICSKCFKAYGKFYAVNTIDSGNGCRFPISIRRRERREWNQAAFPATGSQMERTRPREQSKRGSQGGRGKIN
jgi:hypothetical protein